MEITKTDVLKFNTLQKIVDQLEWCNYECEAGTLKTNSAFIALKYIALTESTGLCRDKLFAALTHAAADYIDQNGCKPLWWTTEMADMAKNWSKDC